MQRRQGTIPSTGWALAGYGSCHWLLQHLPSGRTRAWWASSACPSDQRKVCQRAAPRGWPLTLQSKPLIAFLNSFQKFWSYCQLTSRGLNLDPDLNSPPWPTRYKDFIWSRRTYWIVWCLNSLEVGWSCRNWSQDYLIIQTLSYKLFEQMKALTLNALGARLRRCSMPLIGVLCEHLDVVATGDHDAVPEWPTWLAPHTHTTITALRHF